MHNQSFRLKDLKKKIDVIKIMYSIQKPVTELDNRGHNVISKARLI